MHRFTLAVRAARGWLALLVFGTVLTACSDATTSTDADNPTSLTSAAAAAAANKNNNSIRVTINGLPVGTSASVTVSGPGGYSKAVSATTTLSSLANGTYTVSASTVVVNGTTYAPTPATQAVAVNKGSTGNATVTYAAVVASTGRLTVDITMPDATPASVTVTGPGGYTQTLSASNTLSALTPGSYTVNAANVSNANGTYTAAPASQAVAVTGGATSYASVVYTAPAPVDPPTSLNLRISGMYLTQSVQTMSGAVPLVAGRAGVLRVFATANLANAALPVVRARVYRNGSLVTTLTAIAPELSVPLTVNEGSATASWNFALGGSLIQGGMSILVDVDPNNLIPEFSDADNVFPTNGSPRTFDVRAVPNFDVRFVPVKQSGTGQTGDVSALNAEPFLERTRDMHPINTVTWGVRTPYTTSYTLGSDGTNWNAVLSELYSLRAADGASANYYGVAKVGYGSGVAGMGYIGAPAALGWDYLPTGSEIMAHELGHNWGRQHAPCGGVANPDAAFPYAGGSIGVYGFNVRLGQLLGTTTADLMGYCSPTWISDYTYTNVLSFRGTTTASTTTSASVQPSLLVWGRVETDGSIVLEPAMRITGRSVLPSHGGQYTVEAKDVSGNNVFSLSFDPVEVADERGASGKHFAFVVPVSDATQETLASLSVRGKGRVMARRSSSAETLADVAASASIVVDGARHARVEWNAGTEPMVMVRDAITGEVLSFARGGSAGFTAQNPDIELVVSDGVRSVVKKSRLQGR